MKAQATSYERGGERIRPYKRGDQVLRKCAPNEKDKFSGEIWKGPYRVLAADNDSYLVTLIVPGPGPALGMAIYNLQFASTH